MRRWGPAVLAVILVVGVMSYGVIRWASTPASTSNSTTDNSKSTSVLGTSNSVSPFSSTYFTTQIPSDLHRKTSNENPNAPILASYLFTNVKPSLNDQLAITVGKLGLNRLSEISGVKQRQNDTENYQQTEVDGSPEGAISFKRTSGYETAVFWQHGNMYVAVVVSGQPQRQAELDQVLQTTLSNWAWR